MGDEVRFPRMYLSGSTPSSAKSDGSDYASIERKFLKRAKVKFRCANFAYIYPGAFGYGKRAGELYKVNLEEKIGIMMDSSAFTFHQFIYKQFGALSKKKKVMTQQQIESLRDTTIKQYVKFIKEDGKKWDFYVTFDWVRNCEIIWQMQLYLEKLGTNPVPVYHGDMPLDYFRRYCDRGHKLICIGRNPKRSTYDLNRRWWDRIFHITSSYPEVGIHGLGITGLAVMIDYPWWSVDSSTWIQNSKFGAIAYPDEERRTLRKIHISEVRSDDPSSYNKLPKTQQRLVEEYVENHGFDFEKCRTSLLERCTFNAYMFANLDKVVSKDFISERPEWENLLL